MFKKMTRSRQFVDAEKPPEPQPGTVLSMSASTKIEFDDLLHLVRARRSVRSFTDKALDDGTIERLIDAARWAPSAGNRQPWRVVAVQDQELILRLGQAVRSRTEEIRGDLRPGAERTMGAYLDAFSHFVGAPVVLAFMHRGGLDMLEASRQREGEAAPRRSSGLDPEESALASTAAAIQNLLLAAHSLGLGACWMTGPLLAEEELRELLAAPRGWRLTALVPVGHPAEVPDPPPRRPTERILRVLPKR